jgi:hypothetical protein
VIYTAFTSLSSTQVVEKLSAESLQPRRTSWAESVAPSSSQPLFQCVASGGSFQASLPGGVGPFVPVGVGTLEGRGSGTNLTVQFRWGPFPSFVLVVLLFASAGAAFLVAGRTPMPALTVALLVGAPVSAWWYFAWGVRRILRGLSVVLGGVSWQRAGVFSATGAA